MTMWCGKWLNSLEQRVARILDYGMAAGTIAIDPGIGFGKKPAHNLRPAAQRLDVFAKMGHPLLVGVSRKIAFFRGWRMRRR